jgi:long-chain acyl-CoA synthetase
MKDDSAMLKQEGAVIAPDIAFTLDGLLRERVKLTPQAVAYKDYDEAKGVWRDHTWEAINREVARWQAAIKREALQPGDRVALMLKNCPAWVIFDHAAMGLGLVVVPLYTSDRPENMAYILNDCGAKLLLMGEPEQWETLSPLAGELKSVQRVVCLKPVDARDPRVQSADQWLPAQGEETVHVNRDPGSLASIIYTSGTTGRPKGVMLSHHNMLSNAYDTVASFKLYPEDVFLSFLPLSHTFERTVGYYLTMMAGSTVAYARSIPQLAEDLMTIRPTMLVSVPRIYERVYGNIRTKLEEGPAAKRRLFELAVEVGWDRFEHAQGRGPWKPKFLLWPILKRLVADKVLERLGGRLRAALSGGAALSPEISRVFIGLGLPILQGYGLTETSPVTCCNELEDNLPASIGKPIRNVKVRLGDNDALLVKGPNVMMGYWNNPEATRAVLSEDGWLNTNDTAKIDAEGHVFITGRLKEIIVLANGEKVPPVDMEAAILRDPLFEQVMLLGEGRPYLSVIAVPNSEQWRKFAAENNLSADDTNSERVEQLLLERIGRWITEFPGYAQVRRVVLITEPWTVENGLLTPTMKLKRAKVLEKHKSQYERLYAGH